MSDEVYDRVVKIISSKLGRGVSEVSSSSQLVNDLGMDSLDTVDLILEFEKEFKVEISDSVVDKIKTVGDIVKGIEKEMKR